MRRVILTWVLVLLVTGSSWTLATMSVRAQSDDATPSSSEALASPTPSDTIWFVIAPAGKTNGDFFDVELEPGESETLTGTFGNGSEMPVEALLYAADAYAGTNGGFVMNDSEAPVTAPTNWLDLPTETIAFEAQQAIERSFSVTVPDGTPPGQYITGIALESAEAASIDGDAPFLVKYRLAVAVLITVPGPVEPSFDIGAIEITSDAQTTTITGTIENTGNIRVRPEGTLIVTDASGNDVVTAPIAMGSVYAGNTTVFQVTVPAPLPEGDYTVDTSLEDPDTEAVASVVDVPISVSEPEAPAPVSVSSFDVLPMPSADDVVFAQISVTVSNTGTPVAGAELTLDIYRDGEHVGSQVLGTSLTLQQGETVIEQPYIPESGKWESGSYTFAVTLSATDPATGTETTIVTQESDTAIEVP